MSDCATRPLQDQIIEIYNDIKPRISQRLAQFSNLWLAGDDFDLFVELVFCLLTPSSRAHSADRALKLLLRNDLLREGPEEEIAALLNIVRFRYRKASFILRAREMFLSPVGSSLRGELSRLRDATARREWIVSTVKGIGYKEASHFLRNIGCDTEIAILDRHILRNLCALGLIECVPEHLSAKRYCDIEGKMRVYAERIGVPLSHLDFIFWYRATGDVFK
jgi:N-glycosylase/DNA lyase